MGADGFSRQRKHERTTVAWQRGVSKTTPNSQSGVFVVKKWAWNNSGRRVRGRECDAMSQRCLLVLSVSGKSFLRLIFLAPGARVSLGNFLFSSFSVVVFSGEVMVMI